MIDIVLETENDRNGRDNHPKVLHAQRCLPQAGCEAQGHRRGTDGVSANGVSGTVMFFDRGTFWVPAVPICQNLSMMRTFFPNPSKLVTFAATPLVLTPFVRN